MGVYIKGMEMPTRCGRCDMCVPEADGDTDWHNVCCITEADIVDVGEKMVDCPLVPVPSHGRCVDADKLMQEMRLFIKENMLSRDDARELLETIEDAPTVIEAEEEKNEQHT